VFYRNFTRLYYPSPIVGRITLQERGWAIYCTALFAQGRRLFYQVAKAYNNWVQLLNSLYREIDKMYNQ